MKWCALFAFALISCLFSSCARNTPAGKALSGINKVGQTARNVQAIQSLF